MSEVLDRIEQRGIEQGIEQGIERGIEQGMERGIEQGMEQGMKTINMLNARLLKDGRIKDLERSVSDSAYQERLLAELFPE